MSPARTTVIFDLGGVLIDWNPRHLYRKLFKGDAERMEHFLANVCNDHWNLQQDAGRTFLEATTTLKKEHPTHSELIDAYHLRWTETLGGVFGGSVAVLGDLKDRGVPVYALTNWSAETYPLAEPMYPFLKWFKGVVVSGQEKLIKPDPRIYKILMDRYNVAAGEAIYIDDNVRNVEAAVALGMHGIHFKGAVPLRAELASFGLLPEPPPPPPPEPQPQPAKSV